LHRCLREEYPDCVLPRSLAELDYYPASIRETIYEVMRKKTPFHKVGRAMDPIFEATPENVDVE
jgi:hypothetical protein